jgi:hypothetical protein
MVLRGGPFHVLDSSKLAIIIHWYDLLMQRKAGSVAPSSFFSPDT